MKKNYVKLICLYGLFNGTVSLASEISEPVKIAIAGAYADIEVCDS